MPRLTRTHQYYLLALAAFTVIFLSVSYTLLQPEKKLKIYSPADVNPELADSTVQHISKYHTIPDFSFLNQNGQTITQKQYHGKVYVADFFFTSCQTICPVMTTNMLKVQQAFLHNPDVMLLSHSVLPEQDSVPALKAYAVKKGVVDSKWNLVTGPKNEIYGIARRSYLAVKTSDSSELYDMVHTENFILVDQKRRIRGFYDGTKDADINRLIEDIKFLVNAE